MVDAETSWRILYRVDADAEVILAVFRKTTPATPTRILDEARRRLAAYETALEKD